MFQSVRARVRRCTPYILSMTLTFAGYEALKQVILPDLTTWQSLAMTIAVVGLLSTVFSVSFQGLLSAEAAQDVELAERLRQEERFRALIQHAADVISVVDEDGVIRYQSPAVKPLLGYSETALVGSNIFDLVHPEDLAQVRTSFARLLESPGPGPGIELRVRHHDGAWQPVEAISNNLLEDPRVHGIVITARNIAARKGAEETLRRQARHDALTDLPNRTLLSERVEQALNAARRDDRPLALFLLDLDRFKDINDTLGHHIGDALLREIAGRLQGMLRNADTVARLGGDEFAILLPGADEAGARRVAAALLQVLDAPVALAGHTLHTAASVGIALYPTHGSDLDTLLRHADVAMYAAKNAHAGVTVYATALDVSSIDRHALMTDLRQAITDNTLTLHYQPLASLHTGEVVGLEALLRWIHPKRGLIPPDQFIPLAEQTGLIGAVTSWVLEEALRQWTLWERLGSHPVVQVNLSMRDVQDLCLPDQVAMLLHRHTVPPAQLTLEITESALMADPVRARDVLTRLAALGVRLAIDDFGTGYSSLGYLRELPVHEVKIDQLFVRGMHEHAKDAAIVHSIVALGHALGLTVVAEGVETRAMWDLLEALGCDMAQGYYISRPLPESDVPHVHPSTHADDRSAAARVPYRPVHTMVSLAALAVPDALLAPHTPTEEVLALFDREPGRAAVVIGADDIPLALVTRQGVLTELSRLYGNAIYRTRPIARLARDVLLTVEVATPLDQAVRQATARPLETRYEPLVVTSEGRYVGLVAVSLLLDHLNDAAVLRARMSHPLTGLPGAPVLETEINTRLAASTPVAVPRADIAGYARYVAAYGSARGDAVFLLVARLAQEVVAALGTDDLTGHTGSDGFVIICAPERAAMICRRLAARFATAPWPRDDRPGVAELYLRTVVVNAPDVDTPSYLGLIQEASRRAHTIG